MSEYNTNIIFSLGNKLRKDITSKLNQSFLVDPNTLWSDNGPRHRSMPLVDDYV